MSLEHTDAESASHATAPRVSLESMKNKIASEVYGTAADLRDRIPVKSEVEHQSNLDILTVCVLVMENGFMVTGTSAPASPENFNAEYGRKLAYEDCIRQLWRLEGYALRNELSKA